MAGRFRMRVSSCKLKKRHPRGASGQSNPASCRHRTEAQGARMVANTAMVAVDEVRADPSTDSVLQLPLEEMHIEDGSGDSGDGELVAANKSMVSEGGLSAFTSCTNPTFDAVHRIWRSGSKMHNDVVAVLAAVAELIKENGGEETDVEYFSALLTTFESTSDEEASKLAATAYLLNLIAKKITKDVLQRYFSRTIQILYNKLAGQVNSDNVTLLKNLVAAIGTVLRAQSAPTLQQSSTKMIMVSVATLCTHDKPWVRTMARRVLRAVLTDPVSSLASGVHPAASPVGEFALSVLQQCTGKDVENVVPTRILCLLEGIMHKVAHSAFKRLAEAVLRLMTCTDGMVKCSAMQCLYRVMQRQPSDAVLPVETNVQLIVAIRDFVPPPSDVAVTAYWMQALGEAHVCLTAKDPAESIRHLPRTFEIFVAFFDLSIKTLAQVTMQVLGRLLERCVQKHASVASYCVDLLEKALNMGSVTVWIFVLRTLAKAFEECGEAIETDTLNKTLKTLAQLRDTEDCFCKGELDLTVGAAVRYVGVDRVLRAIPLDVDPDLPLAMIGLKRSWLLPVLRVNISSASLSIFVRFFLPLAVKLHKKAGSVDLTLAKIFAAVQHQIWELLPQFLNSATEFEKYFPELAPVLGSALSERADLRMVVLSSIRSAVRFAQQPDAPAERIEVMRRYAKNYLPILFNMYTLEDNMDDHTEKAVHLATLETIRVYVELAPPELINRYIRSAVEKACSAEKSLLKKLHILDVLGALAKRADAEGLGTIFNAVREWFFTEEASLQKKAFRNLEEIMKRSGDVSVRSFFDSYAEEISNVLTEDCVERTALSARATLIGILQLRLQELSTFDELKQFIAKVLKQVVTCLDKSHNVHARKVAFKCLVETCQRLLSFGCETGEEPSASLEPVLDVVYEMATTKAWREPAEIPFNIAQSTMVTLNVIAQKYLRDLNASLLNRLIAHACSCIGDGRPAVRVLVIRLMRVLTQKLPDYALQQYKEMIISAVFEGQLTADVTQKVRKANRLLLEELVNRLGVQALMKSTDKADWLKQMKAIEKIRRRRERRAEALATGVCAVESEADDDEDARSLSSKSVRTAGADTVLDMLIESDEQSDSGVDSEAEERKSRAGRSKSNAVWLKGGDDAEMVDLLDRETMIGKVTVVKPAPRDSARKTLTSGSDADSGFKFTESGRLIIEDLGSLSAGRKRRQRDSIMDIGGNVQSKKKKFEEDDESTDGDSETNEEPTEDLNVAGWKPGGRGIRRDARHGAGILHAEGAGFKSSGKAYSDFKKKGAKFEPFAYVPLRKKKGAAMERRKLIAGAKRDATKGSKGKRRQKGKKEAAL